VRGHRRGRGRSFHGRRGALGRGGARGGEGEAGGGPEWPARGGVPDGRRRRRLLVAALRGGCSSAWLVEANARAAALAAGGTSGRFTSAASGSGEQRNDIGGRARAREMAMVLAI
jgi:hypothetical protein